MSDLIALKISNPEKHLSGIKKPNTFSLEQKQKLAKAAKDFEALLTSMMLKSMMPKDGGIFGDKSLGGQYFDSIFNMEFSNYMTKSKGLGLAEEIYEKVVGEKFNASLIPVKLKTQGIAPKKIENNSFETIKPSDKSLTRLTKYEPIIREAAGSFGVSDSLIKSVILAESSGRAEAVSKANAKGLMQLLDSTAMDMGVKNIFDPKENIFGGTKYLSLMLNEFNNDLDLALAAYNAGPGNVKKHNGIPPFKETQNYVKRIKAYHNYFKD